MNKCIWCGCNVMSDKGTCEHCGAPFVPEEKKAESTWSWGNTDISYCLPGSATVFPISYWGRIMPGSPPAFMPSFEGGWHDHQFPKPEPKDLYEDKVEDGWFGHQLPEREPIKRYDIEKFLYEDEVEKPSFWTVLLGMPKKIIDAMTDVRCSYGD